MPKIIKTRIGAPLFCLKSCESTNDIAKKLAENNFPEGTSVVAKLQTKGKGRLGRKWLSPQGENIYFSVVLRPDVNHKEITFLSIVAAAAVTKAILAFCRKKVEIKWPNDIYISGKKVSGILAEAKSRADKVKYVVIGIGVNLNSDLGRLPRKIRDMSTSLSIACRRKIGYEDFLEKLTLSLNIFYLAYLQNRKKLVLKLVNRNLYQRNKAVKFHDGKRIIPAVLIKVNHNGSLSLRTEKGTCNFSQGEVLK